MNNKKQICLVTFYKSDNYGTNLQAYALETILQRLKYDVEFLKTFKVKSEFIKHPMLLYAWISLKLNLKKNKAFYHPDKYLISENRQRRLTNFQKEFFKEKSYITSKDWKTAINNNVIFVVGSDILWNPVRGYPGRYFLDFAYYSGLKRFSYASSVGSLELPKKFFKAYKRYLGSMEAVGVREESVKKMLEPIVEREVTQVVDPTLLLTRNDWEVFAESAEVSVPINNNGFVLCYFVMNDPRYWKYVKLISQTYNKQIIVLPMHKLDEDQPYDIITDGTPPEFVWLIKNADFICTDSFHACVISSIFHKEFYLLRRTRKAENAKYDDFLNRYGLAERSVRNEKVFELMPTTDFSVFDARVSVDRKNAIAFLRTALKKCK